MQPRLSTNKQRSTDEDHSQGAHQRQVYLTCCGYGAYAHYGLGRRGRLGVGGVFNLGKLNTVDAITKLAGSVAGSSLQINNNSTGTAATALDLRGGFGQAALEGQ